MVTTRQYRDQQEGRINNSPKLKNSKMWRTLKQNREYNHMLSNLSTDGGPAGNSPDASAMDLKYFD